ncbi:hypothetical protein D3C81_2219080 [compost metagenome]
MLALFGPPLVMMYKWSTSLKEFVVAIIRTNKVVGMTSGSVIVLNFRIGPAPSNSAA